MRASAASNTEPFPPLLPPHPLLLLVLVLVPLAPPRPPLLLDPPDGAEVDAEEPNFRALAAPRSNRSSSLPRIWLTVLLGCLNGSATP